VPAIGFQVFFFISSIELGRAVIKGQEKLISKETRWFFPTKNRVILTVFHVFLWSVNLTYPK